MASISVASDVSSMSNRWSWEWASLNRLPRSTSICEIDSIIACRRRIASGAVDGFAPNKIVNEPAQPVSISRRPLIMPAWQYWTRSAMSGSTLDARREASCLQRAAVSFDPNITAQNGGIVSLEDSKTRLSPMWAKIGSCVAFEKASRIASTTGQIRTNSCIAESSAATRFKAVFSSNVGIFSESFARAGRFVGAPQGACLNAPEIRF